MNDTIVRAPNHLGDVCMALPALEAAGADVMVTRWLAPLLEMAELPGRIIPLERGRRGVPSAVRALRERRYRRGVILPPSFSSALLFALGGVAERRGTATDRRRALLTESVDPADIAPLHTSARYWYLVTGERRTIPPVPRLRVPAGLKLRFDEIIGRAADAPLIGVFPGSAGPAKRWAPERYAELVSRLVEQGGRMVVFGGPNERELTAFVAGGRALDLGGRTDLPLLAAGLQACDLLITNDSGPMHLAAAVGTRTVALLGPADPRATAPLGAGHLVLQREDLLCVPCVKNHCPRTGPGYILPDAVQECLRLINVDEVEAATKAGLTQLSAFP